MMSYKKHAYYSYQFYKFFETIHSLRIDMWSQKVNICISL